MIHSPVAVVQTAHNQHPTPVLWYREPAKSWEEALPIGNGSLGGMVFGGVQQERVQFNEETLWSGEPQESDNPNALRALNKVRDLLNHGKVLEAQKLTDEQILCQGVGSNRAKGAGVPFGCYQTFGNLNLTFHHEERVKNYRRELDMDRAAVHVTYSVGDANYTRTYFVSAPDKVMAIHIACDKPGQINLSAEMNRICAAKTLSGDCELVMEGQLYHERGMKFASRLHGYCEGGEVVSSNGILKIEGASSALLLLSADTDYKEKKPLILTSERIEQASKRTFDELKKRHIRDFSSLFHRVSLNLGGKDLSSKPTNERLDRVRKGKKDPQLISQYFQFGRYLLISSARPGSLPPNLQGIWADGTQTPWNCDFHTNVNLQMNHWLAGVTNLSECHLPLFDFIEGLTIPGEKTARVHYNARGWVVHHITNVWGFTSPAESAKWGMFPGGSGWLCQHLWEHYVFTEDKEFLARVFPIMKSAAIFYLDYLTPDPITGCLVSGPSSSPENIYRTEKGEEANVCMGPSMDQQIIWDLFTNTVKAARVLDVDPDLTKTLEINIARLAPPKIGKDGRLMEWQKEYDEPEPGHRHISHAFGLYPGSQFTMNRTPELAEAVRKSIEKRLQHGGGHTGWSRAWIINLWARLRDAENAAEHVHELLAKSTLPNLFDNHPPFQIDGNFGGTAGIAEMLIQSHDGEIHLLPALPKEWKTGKFKGLRARGGVQVDLKWSDGKVDQIKLRAQKSGYYDLRFDNQKLNIHLEKGKDWFYNNS